MVKLPSTVVGISDNAFRSCKLLSSVTAPGCREFGYKAFDECCSLQWVSAADGIANQVWALPLSRLHQPCEFTLRESPSPSELPSQSTASDLALGCLSSMAELSATANCQAPTLCHESEMRPSRGAAFCEKWPLQDVSSTAEECLRSAAPLVELVSVTKRMTVMSLHRHS